MALSIEVIERKEGEYVIKLEGRLDTGTAPQLKDKVARCSVRIPKRHCRSEGARCTGNSGQRTPVCQSTIGGLRSASTTSSSAPTINTPPPRMRPVITSPRTRNAKTDASTGFRKKNIAPFDAPT